MDKKDKTMNKPQIPLLRRPVIRILVIWSVESIGLVLLAWIMKSVTVTNFPVAVATTAVIGLLNALLWPLFGRIIVPFAVFTLGLGALVMNGIVIMLTSNLLEGFEVASLGSAILLAVLLTAVNTIASTLLTIDDEGSWYRNVVKRRIKRKSKPVETDVPGIFFLEIDGLAKPVLEKAMAAGYAPTIKRWLENGSHQLVGWETDLSSQTSASQAGILHGNNDNIPAFRWYDRQRKQIVASSNPDEVSALEKRHSDGNGLLADGGASRGNLLSGDAPIVSVTASTMKDLSRLHTGDFYAYFISPYNITRTVVLAVWDVILEKRQFRRARKNNVTPILDKHHRGGKYPLLRVFTTIVMREINIYTLIGDMYAGVPSAYATFVGYDEVAHHSGVESEDALDTLRKLDEQFARLESAAKGAPRPYKFVVLSDHGQSGGPTFLQRYGFGLEELVRQLAKTHFVQAVTETNESWGHVNVFLTDVVKNDEKAGKAVGRMVKKNMTNDEVVLGPDKHESAQLPSETDIVVLASGNLGLVYGTKRENRIVLEEMETYLPGLLDGLVAHEGIGWVMVKSVEHGPVAIGRNGRHYLASGKIEGSDPLAAFGPNAARHLLRYNEFTDAPDMYINSFYNAETNEVAAFEELIGCHGGMGGYQTRPFLLYPADLSLTEPDLVGAPAVYRQLKTWLRQTQNG